MLRRLRQGRWLTIEHGSGAAVAYEHLRTFVSSTVCPDIWNKPTTLSTLPASELALLPPAPTLRIQAVAAQGYTEAELVSRLETAANLADGLLLVSGDVQTRTSSSLSTVELLRLAVRLRDAGRLRNAALLVAANPLLQNADSASRLREKLDAGAQGVMTQPHNLLPVRWLRWWDGPAGAVLRGHVPVGMGAAVPRSRKDVELWLRLAQVDQADDDAAALLQTWARADAMDDLSRSSLVGALDAARELGCGLHLMPMRAAGYAFAARAIDPAAYFDPAGEGRPSEVASNTVHR